MKVALLGSRAFDSLEFHLADSFRYLGHQVHHVDMADFIPLTYLYNYWFSKFVPKYAELMFGKLASKIIEFEPDLVVCTYRFIPALAIIKIKKALTKIPVVQINPDQLTTFEKQQIFSSPYDFYFTKDPFIVDFMKDKAGLNAYYLPEAFNSRIHTIPVVNRAEHERKIDIDVLAFGSWYPYRVRLIKKLIDAGIKMTLYGNGQHHFPELKKYFVNELITGTKKADLLFGAKVVFNNYHYAEVDSVNCKFFEIVGCGGFQICDFKPTVHEYSAVTTDKFTFKKIDEGIDLIKFYLDKPQLRYDIADQQREHFLAHHTYDIRISEMLNIIFK
jgi:spore maturation protein CgeB